MKIFHMKNYIPSPEELATKELAYNLEDDRLSLKVDSGKVIDILKIESEVKGDSSYTKLPDGTMLASGTVIYSSKPTTEDNRFGTTAGVVHRGDSEIIFPEPFVSIPVVTMNGSLNSNHTRVGVVSNYNAYFVEWTKDAQVDAQVGWIAIGRWK